MLIKQLHILEKRRPEFRAEANNALNHFNPGTPNTTIGQPGTGAIRAGNAGRSMEAALNLSLTLRGQTDAFLRIVLEA